MSVDDYLQRLPAGIESYPEARSKASVVQTFLRPGDVERLSSKVPAEVLELLENPPPPSVWVPEVHAQVVYLAQRELFESDEAYVEHARARNLEIAQSPMYRVLFRALSHRMVIRLVVQAWVKLHLGTEATAEVVGDEATFTLSYPPHLFPPLMSRCLNTAFEVALVLSGAKELEVGCLGYDETQVTFTGRWR